METKEYIITKKQCQDEIDKRMPVVCRGCGGKIEPLETVDNADRPTYWTGCESCQVFDPGTSPEIHGAAVKMVDEHGFTAYGFERRPDKEKDPERFNYWRREQIRGTVSVIMAVKQSLKEAAQSA